MPESQIINKLINNSSISQVWFWKYFSSFLKNGSFVKQKFVLVIKKLKWWFERQQIFCPFILFFGITIWFYNSLRQGFYFGQ